MKNEPAKSPLFCLSILSLVCLSTNLLVENTLAFFPQQQALEPDGTSPDPEPNPDPQPKWWKGNLHTHSLWSDGNDFPEVISDWYRQRGYHFLAISDHNVLQEGAKWMDVDRVQQRSHGKGMERYLEKFGKSWVETRGEPGTEKYQVRLKPLDEYRYLLERNNHFILIPAEEITDSAQGHPVHMNATNLDEVIKPLGGKTVREAMENNLRAVLELEKAKGREILPHLNHPNFKYGITFEDLAAVMSERFFEVYNGHPDVHHLGDPNNPGVERMWDLANHLRVNKLGGSILYGVGTDDSHEYFGKAGSRPGRGWVMVRSKFLTPEHLIRAMKAGDFYASSGTTLKDVRWDPQSKTLSVDIDPQEGVTYKTEYLVTDIDAKPEDIGRTGLASQQLSSSYTLKKGESIVRAVITASIPPEDPVWKEQLQQAWTQPFSTSQ